MATVTLGGNAVHVEGNFPQVGAQASDFTLVKNDLGELSLHDLKGKKVIACARLAKYKEVVNDHQRQIIENFDKAGYIIGVTDLKDLDKALTRAKDFKPKKYISNTKKFVKLVEKMIEE